MCIWAVLGDEDKCHLPGPMLEVWLLGGMRGPSVDVKVPTLSPALTQQLEGL